MKKKVTLLDIANELDITASTVSRALNDHPRISRDTKNRVRAAVKRMNYRPNSIAAALRKGRSQIIGVIVPTSDRHFFASVIRGIEEETINEGYNLIICQSDDQTSKEIENIESLLQIQVDGIIASVAKETSDLCHYEKVRSQGVPLVLFDRVSDTFGVSAVSSDDYLGAFKAVTHLIEQGCRRIIHFGGQQHINIYRSRLKGYKDALLQHNRPIYEDDIYIHDIIADKSETVRAGRALGQKCLERDEPFDGIFSASDFAAIGAMQVLKENHIDIPGQVALAGYSNDFSASVVDPGLTSVDQMTKRMGKYAGRLFLEQVNCIANGQEFTPGKTALTPKLVIRNSSLRTTHVRRDSWKTQTRGKFAGDSASGRD